MVSVNMKSGTMNVLFVAISFKTSSIREHQHPNVFREFFDKM